MRISDCGLRIADWQKHLQASVFQSAIRIPHSAILFAALLVLALSSPLFAKCPVSEGATLVLRAPVGNLLVDTTGRDAVEVEVNNKQIEVRETCNKERIEITGNPPIQIQGTIEWRILVPKATHLDLVAYAGSIRVGDSDGNVTLRTTGGSVTVGQIKGRVAIITQGGFIKSGNVGDDAELRSQGGSLEVGNVAGDAELETGVGPINAGIISGRVKAETAGGSITIKESRGEVVAHTAAGDISVGDAVRINAKTAGGNITSRRVRGPFQGHTESGDIRLDNAASWVEASTGFGNIFVKLMPENFDADLHVDLQTGVGDVMIYLPERMKATVDATVERPAFEAPRIFSDFPMNAIGPARIQGLAPSRFLAPLRSQTVLNGGRNSIKLHTSLGKIEIRKN